MTLDVYLTRKWVVGNAFWILKVSSQVDAKKCAQKKDFLALLTPN